MEQVVCPKVRQYIEEEIFPRYEKLPGHSLNHIKTVIKRSLRIANTLKDIDINMVYVIAAYHDLGREIDDEKHNLWSGYLLRRDESLKRLFEPEEIEIMAEAVEDHRASLKTEPRSIYGKIVSSADRSCSVNEILARAYDYNRHLHPDYTDEQLCEAVRKILRRKYTSGGYASQKIYYLREEYDEFLKIVEEITREPEKFQKLQQEFNKERGL